VTEVASGQRAPIVVGVDGSAASEQAVRLAAAEAVGRGCVLRLVHAFRWTAADVDNGTSPRDATDQLLDRATKEARAAAPEVDAVAEIAEGEPVTVLLRAAASVDLLAIGDGGLSSYDCLPPNAIVVRLAAEAACSVLVARDTAVKPGPVLVGMDSSRNTNFALQHAFEIAAHRGANLLAMHVTETDDRPDRVVPEPELDPVRREKVSSCQRRYPQVAVDMREVKGDPVRVLTDEGASAALVVVGACGDLPTRSLLGAVSMGVLHHAPCPVVVCRAPVRD
jgi:nucleotide-binding universal stress UspA family protein